MAGDRRRIDDHILNHDSGARPRTVLLGRRIAAMRPSDGQELAAAPIY
jgi:hypothetical protein